jgi:choline dehydrogenase-like flavoprotein
VRRIIFDILVDLQDLRRSGKFFTVQTAVVSPAARGSISLSTVDPFVQPLIDPGLLNSEYDIATIRESIKTSIRFANASAWRGFLDKPFEPLKKALEAGTDEALEEYARNTASTVWHPTSTAAMSNYNSSDGVLDPDLCVKGTVGLRVVDASAFVRSFFS